MGHNHDGHGHDHTHGANKKTLFIAFLIITGYMIVEVIGGLLTNSLALLSDAGHMLSDAISLAIGILAFSLGEKVANNEKTYGYKRFEILAAVFNGITLIAIALFIFYEAIERFANPPEVASTGMLYIATIGLLVNIFVAWILMRGGGTKDNLNMRAAFLHVISDMLGSVGAIIAALLILFFDWGWADPLASVIVAALVLVSGFRVTKDAVHVLMEGTPVNVNIDEIIRTFRETEGVLDLHDLHIWSITSGQNALSCHAVVQDTLTMKEGQIILQTLEHQLQHLSIHHVTIQLEPASHKHENTLLCNFDTQHEHNHAH
ncbi:cation diffusion facilitator family transporter [Lysinibacillus sp. LZ02]|uniref:cation diffusion facilitator family transporter n=1 Tax=Lysinibacillus sp. LZ02 TaxID=3420668 RepID=UPI003D35C873